MKLALAGLLAAFAAALLLSSCAEVPTDPEERAEFEQINDPLEPMNRKIFDVNTWLDDHVMEPVARTYHDTLPQWLQTAIHNFLTNLNEPYVGGNELLQGRFRQAWDDLGRFVFNTTFGLAGTRDLVADTGGPKANDTDIGLTLGTWGIGEGPYLMLPFFGPSNPRDTAGRVADYFADPVNEVIGAQGNTNWATDTRFGADTLDTRVQYLGPLADLKRSSLDYYASIRSLYRQKRRAYLGQSGESGIDTGGPTGPGQALP